MSAHPAGPEPATRAAATLDRAYCGCLAVFATVAVGAFAVLALLMGPR